MGDHRPGRDPPIPSGFAKGQGTGMWRPPCSDPHRHADDPSHAKSRTPRLAVKTTDARKSSASRRAATYTATRSDAHRVEGRDAELHGHRPRGHTPRLT